MGKRQLGEMQPFELVLTLIIADLATVPMAEVSVPVLHGVVPLLTLVFLHFVLTVMSAKSTKFSRFLSGKPIIVINPDGIDYKALKNLNMSVDDIFEAIRGCGYFRIEQIQYAIMETNGKMSVLPKSDCAPITIADLNLEADNAEIPINLINDGKLLKKNMQIANVDEGEIADILHRASVKKVKDVLLLTIDKNGDVFLQRFGKKFQTFNIKEQVQK